LSRRSPAHLDGASEPAATRSSTSIWNIRISIL
jgi:hypothetical protein